MLYFLQYRRKYDRIEVKNRRRKERVNGEIRVYSNNIFSNEYI